MSPFVVNVGAKNKSLVFKILLSVVPKLILKEALFSFIRYRGKESYVLKFLTKACVICPPLLSIVNFTSSFSITETPSEALIALWAKAPNWFLRFRSFMESFFPAFAPYSQVYKII